MSNLVHLVNTLPARRQKGQGLTEYALIIALVAIVAVAALTLLGGQVSAIFGDITTSLGG